MKWKFVDKAIIFGMLMLVFIGGAVTFSSCKGLPPLPDEANGKEWETFEVDPAIPAGPPRKFHEGDEYFEAHEEIGRDIKLKWPNEEKETFTLTVVVENKELDFKPVRPSRENLIRRWDELRERKKQ